MLSLLEDMNFLEPVVIPNVSSNENSSCPLTFWNELQRVCELSHFL